jgi:hypothetical protein
MLEQGSFKKLALNKINARYDVAYSSIKIKTINYIKKINKE